MIFNRAKLFSFHAILFIFATSFFMLLSSGFIDSQDGFQYLTIARRMYYDHTFEMPQELFPEGNIHMSLVKGSDEKIYSPTGLGYSLSLIPAVFVEDLLTDFAGVRPHTAFPLNNDWPVLLVASWINGVWAGLFVVGLYSYLRILYLSHKQSAVLSLLLVLSSNILPYTKHSFAQMMFVTCLLYSFLNIRKAFLSDSRKSMMVAGVWFGLVVISYNPTFLFTLPALGVYYLILLRESAYLNKVSQFLKDLFWAGFGFLPLGIAYWWFNWIRFGGVGEAGYNGGVAQGLSFPPIYVIIEGFWGLLFSPGKSIFLHSPLLLVLLVFWFKIPKRILPELWAALVMFGVYLWFIGTLLGGPDYLVWHGESSWGPRYMLPVLPLLLLIVGVVISKLKQKEVLVGVLPLVGIGLLISFLGVVLPYQIRFAGLQTDVFINSRNFTVYEYGNEIPRYAPFFKQAKHFARQIISLPNLYDRGKYQLQLRDGFGEPYQVGNKTWRGILDRAEFAFLENTNAVSTIELDIMNYQISPESSQSAQISLIQRNKLLKTATIAANEVQTIAISNLEKPDDTLYLHLRTVFDSSRSAELKKEQVIFLREIRVNGELQNIASIDYPYVSRVSQGLLGTIYTFWGKEELDPWSIWHMHSIVYEKTIDFWWIKYQHYWDVPQNVIRYLFVANCALFVGSSFVLIRSLRDQE